MQSTKVWAVGAAGEEKLAQALAGIAGIRVLHDRRIRGSRRNIDHIVIAPVGVFVVDAKRYKGMIRVRDVGGWLRTDKRLFVGRRDCSMLADGLGWQVAAVRAATRETDVDTPSIEPVLCFVDGEWPILSAPSEFRGVRLESPRSLARRVGRWAGRYPIDVERVTRALATALPSANR